MTTKKPHQIDIQMRFADVDILGHVNNVNLQHYFDTGKHAFFRDVIRMDMDWNKIGVITAATSSSYFAQTHPEDSVYVETQVEKIGNKSISFYQRLLSRLSGEVKAESRSVIVAFDFELQVSITVPEEWRKVM